ncbi:MAG: hypothetical protein JW793_10075 [Acidobacteria bacterium]|nr:hypothetical protein [Acidobacteriota bacterium]
MRWHKTKRGTAPEEFRYPRGLSFGCIQWNGKILDCVAVADAWNRRVQLLDPEGNLRAVWAGEGQREFGEIADVRFIPEHEESACFWYVLDRGESCLWKMNPDGTTLDRIGRLFPSNLQKRWAVTAAFFSCPDRGFIAASTFSPLDFTFYPERILGNTPESLFISEDSSRKLKQVLPPHLIPLHFDDPDTAECIAADSSSLLFWDRSVGQLVRRTVTAGGRVSAEIVGNPIPSDADKGRFWLQNSDCIEEWEWDIPADLPADAPRERGQRLVWCAPNEAGRLDPAAVLESVEICLKHLDDEIKLGNSILAMTYDGIPSQYKDEMSRHAVEFNVKCALYSQKIREALHHWSLEQLTLRIAGSPRSVSTKPPDFPDRLKKEFGDQIAGRVHEINNSVDALNARLSSLLTDSGEDQPSPDLWIHIAGISRSNLEFGKEWIESLSGIRTQYPVSKAPSVKVKDI